MSENSKQSAILQGALIQTSYAVLVLELMVTVSVHAVRTFLGRKRVE